uniref:Uncharacterized protein n=1 Tax=Rhizophora mucronata TaxID=61149 RepID=A0A2P2J5I6_RHIMU
MVTMIIVIIIIKNKVALLWMLTGSVKLKPKIRKDSFGVAAVLTMTKMKVLLLLFT